MLITEALLSFREALKVDGDIKDFCNSKYNKDLTVFLGADQRDLPDVNNAPYVLLDRASVRFSEKNLERYGEYDFYLLICIYQDRITKDDAGVIYDGVVEIDNLSYLVRKSISSLDLPVSFVSESVAGTTDTPLRNYPVYYHVDHGQLKLRENRAGG